MKYETETIKIIKLTEIFLTLNEPLLPKITFPKIPKAFTKREVWTSNGLVLVC